jgi:hypothetical protein
MVSHVSHSVYQEHIYTRWARIVGTVQDSWDGLTCLTFGACTKEHIYKGGPG